MTDNLAQNALSLSLTDSEPRSDLDSIPSTPKIIEHSSYRTHDITNGFTEASKALRTGQLVKDESFTLFESVSALEIMDPKMDSGVLSLGEEFGDTYDVSAPLLPEEVLDIMDQLFCYEMAWLEGYPLSQTVFTSLHIDKILDLDPKTLPDVDNLDSEGHWNRVVLRSYCYAVIKTCEMIIRVITAQHQHFYEEEDFVTHAFNRELFANVSTAEFISRLSAALDFVEIAQHGMNNPVIVAIAHRLRNRAAFLDALERSCDMSVFEENPDPTTRSLWTKIKKQALDIRLQHRSAQGVPAAFSGNVQRKLASTVPPRPVIEKSYEAASKFFIDLCDDILVAYTALDFDDNDSSEDIITFLWSFNSRDPCPSTLARAFLQNLVVGTDRVFRVWAVEELVVKELQEYALANDWFLLEENWQIEVPGHPRYRAARLVDDFLTRACPAYLNVLRGLCQNRCRVRRNFQHLMRDSERFEDDARKIDALLLQYWDEISTDPKETTSRGDAQEDYGIPRNMSPLYTWTQHCRIRLMEWFLQLGFEQELYKPHEFSYMYQILYSITSLRLSDIDATVELIHIRNRYHSRDISGDEQILFERSIQWSMRALETSFKCALAFGLHILYTILQRLSLITPPTYPYGNDSLRSDIRMKPFHGLMDLSRPNTNIVETDPNSSQQHSITDLFRQAEETIQRQKKQKEAWKHVPQSGGCRVSKAAWDKERKAMQLSYVAMSVALAKLKIAYECWGEDHVAENMSVKVPSPHDCYHKWWIVPVLEERKV